MLIADLKAKYVFSQGTLFIYSPYEQLLRGGDAFVFGRDVLRGCLLWALKQIVRTKLTPHCLLQAIRQVTLKIIHSE